MRKPCTSVLSSISERRYSSRFYSIVRGIEMEKEDFSINLSSIFIKLMGIWMANGQSEKCVRNVTIVYSIIALLFGLWLQITDMYYSWGDFSVSIHYFCYLLKFTNFYKISYTHLNSILLIAFYCNNCASIR